MTWEVSQAEAAGILDVSYRTLTNTLKKCQEGKLHREGGRVNVDLDVLIPYLIEKNPRRYGKDDYRERLEKLRVSQEDIASIADNSDVAIPIANRNIEQKTGDSDKDCDSGYNLILRDATQSSRELARKYEQDLTREREGRQQDQREFKRQNFSLKLMTATAVLVAFSVVGFILFGIGRYQGRGGELNTLEANLSATNDSLAREQGRADHAEAKLTEAEIKAQELAAEIERLQQERNKAIQDLAEEINKGKESEGGFFWQFLKPTDKQ